MVRQARQTVRVAAVRARTAGGQQEDSRRTGGEATWSARYASQTSSGMKAKVTNPSHTSTTLGVDLPDGEAGRSKAQLEVGSEEVAEWVLGCERCERERWQEGPARTLLIMLGGRGATRMGRGCHQGLVTRQGWAPPLALWGAFRHTTGLGASSGPLGCVGCVTS